MVTSNENKSPTSLFFLYIELICTCCASECNKSTLTSLIMYKVVYLDIKKHSWVDLSVFVAAPGIGKSRIDSSLRSTPFRVGFFIINIRLS